MMRIAVLAAGDICAGFGFMFALSPYCCVAMLQAHKLSAVFKNL
jgi:hypothetical protein